MTDCIHNDKRTCFHERLEMNAEIQKLKADLRALNAEMFQKDQSLLNAEMKYQTIYRAWAELQDKQEIR